MNLKQRLGLLEDRLVSWNQQHEAEPQISEPRQFPIAPNTLGGISAITPGSQADENQFIGTFSNLALLRFIVRAVESEHPFTRSYWTSFSPRPREAKPLPPSRLVQDKSIPLLSHRGMKQKLSFRSISLPSAPCSPVSMRICIGPGTRSSRHTKEKSHPRPAYGCGFPYSI